MSIHVVSAVLSCRDKTLTSSRRMVLVCLANYAGDDGRAWPSQQLIADESGCGLRSVKDHIKWLDKNGFLTRKTKNLGQGNGSRTAYHISLSKLRESVTDGGADNARAEFARAKSSEARCSILPLTNRQEPSVDNANALLRAQDAPPPEPPKPKPRSKRGSRMSEAWAPTPTDYAYAKTKNLTPQETNHEADQFRNHHLARGTISKCWAASWRTWVGNTAKWKAERQQRLGANQPGGVSKVGAAFDRVIAQMEGHGDQRESQTWADGTTIDGVYSDATPGRGSIDSGSHSAGAENDAGTLFAAGSRGA